MDEERYQAEEEYYQIKSDTKNSYRLMQEK